MVSADRLYRSLMLLILVSLIPAAMGMWGDRLEISAKVRTGEALIHITSYKAQSFKEQAEGNCISSDALVTLNSDGRSVDVVFTDISEGWYAWVGLVISNDGNFPKTIGKPGVLAPIYISATSFLYGPFKAVGNSGVWGGVDICVMTSNLRDGGNPFPNAADMYSIYLQPGYKAVAWVFINYTGSDNVSLISVTITI